MSRTDEIPAPPITEPGMPSNHHTIWGLPDISGVNPTSSMVLRKTNLFGVLIRDKTTGNILSPDDPLFHRLLKTRQGLIDFREAENFVLQDRHNFDIYYPDILNDLRLSDHAPLIQNTAQGRVASFNIMYQCKADNYNGKPCFNNAHQKIESNDNYKKRLDLLADFIIQMVRENNLNVLTLQETPSLTSEAGKNFYDKINKALPGYGVVPGENGLATLFNGNALDYVSGKNDPNRELHTQFRNKITKEPFTVINVHWKLGDAAQNTKRAHDLLTSPNQHIMIMGDTNICANDTARDKLDAANKSNHEIAMSHLSTHPGMHAPVEDDLESHSKNNTTTMDMILISPTLITDITPLYQINTVSSGFQTVVEKLRQENIDTMPSTIREFFWHFTEADSSLTRYPGNNAQNTGANSQSSVANALNLMAKAGFFAPPPQAHPANTLQPQAVLAKNADELLDLWKNKSGDNGISRRGDYINFTNENRAYGICDLLKNFNPALRVADNSQTHHQNYSIRFSSQELSTLIANLTQVITDYETAKNQKSRFQSFSKESGEAVETLKKILSGDISDNTDPLFKLEVKSSGRLANLLQKYDVTIQKPEPPAAGLHPRV